ncbi:MAG: sigma-70 family RNA polymerase sigma factor [Actinobacteria bacterium]|nr:sigma-70 family RNA polymerase sigma factor [Actinomycetota bacterium]
MRSDDARRRQRRGAPDEVDWAEIYRDYLPRVRSYVRGRVPSAWVEDTAQDTFARAFRSRRRFDDSRPVWPWLVTIARRACIETCRAHPIEVPFDPAVHGAVAPDDPHAELERRLQAQAIDGALGLVSPRHRHLLVSYEVQGRPFASLAEEEHISRQALKSALCRARDSFRTNYSTLAERRGLVSLPIVGPLVARLRRWRRAFGVASFPAELAGAVVVGVGATAMFVGVPVGSPAHTAVAVGATDESLAAVAIAVEESRIAAGDTRPRAAVEARSESPVRPVATAGTPDRPRAVRAAGDADVVFTPTESSATIGVDWSSPELGGEFNTSVTIECRGPVWQAVCAVARATPNAG